MFPAWIYLSLPFQSQRCHTRDGEWHIFSGMSFQLKICFITQCLLTRICGKCLFHCFSWSSICGNTSRLYSGQIFLNIHAIGHWYCCIWATETDGTFMSLVLHREFHFTNRLCIMTFISFASSPPFCDERQWALAMVVHLGAVHTEHIFAFYCTVFTKLSCIVCCILSMTQPSKNV